MPTIVDDLRALAASPTSRTRAEVVEILLTAAERIESKRIVLARLKHDSDDIKRGS